MSSSASSLVAAITRLAEPLVASLDLELWGVEISLGSRSVVRVFAEGENGVTIDQCARLSRLLALSLDVEDCIPGAYVLEVSSPGLERIFFTREQLARAVGTEVEVSLHEPLAEFPGCRKLRGVLREARESEFILEAVDPAAPVAPGRPAAFTFDAAKRVRQIHEIPVKTLPGKAKKEKKTADAKGVKPDIPDDASRM